MKEKQKSITLAWSQGNIPHVAGGPLQPHVTMPFFYVNFVNFVKIEGENFDVW